MRKSIDESRSEIILVEALQLEAGTQAFVAEVLLESLNFKVDIAISREWMLELRRRCGKIDRGNTRLIDNEKTIAELRGKFS